MRIYMKLGRTEAGKLAILVYPTNGEDVGEQVDFAIINNLKEDFDFASDPTLPQEHAAIERQGKPGALIQ